MAAYQPIEVGGLSRPNGFGLADTFHQMRQDQEAKRKSAFDEMIRQGVDQRAQSELQLRQQAQANQLQRQKLEDQRATQDRNVQIANKIQDLHEAGLSHEAQQLAGLVGLTSTTEEGVTGPPKFGQLYDNAELSKSAHDIHNGAQADATTQATGPAGYPVQQQAPQPTADYGPQEAPPQQPQQATPAPSQGDQHYDQVLAQYHPTQVFHYAGPGGLSFDVNPALHEQEQLTENQQRAEKFRGAFAKAPSMQPYADEFAARVQLGEEPKQVFADLSARQKADAAARLKAEEDRKYKNEGLSFEQQKELARIKAAAAGAVKTLPEAEDLGHEMDKALEPVTDKRLGIAARQAQLRDSISQVQKQPDNPTAWTNFIDGMIRTNTGRAAIVAQYNLYTHNAGGTIDQIQNWAQHSLTGAPGAAIQKSLLGAASGAYNELAREGAENRQRFHSTYANDPRVKRNAEAMAKFRAKEATQLGGLQDHPAGDDVGTVRDVPGKGKMRKVAPNRWEPTR